MSSSMTQLREGSEHELAIPTSTDEGYHHERPPVSKEEVTEINIAAKTFSNASPADDNPQLNISHKEMMTQLGKDPASSLYGQDDDDQRGDGSSTEPEPKPNCWKIISACHKCLFSFVECHLKCIVMVLLTPPLIIVGIPVLIVLIPFWVVTFFLLYILMNLVGLILEGIPSLRRPPSYRSMDKQTGTIGKLRDEYEKRQKSVKCNPWYKVCVAVLLIAVFISKGTTKGRGGSDLLGFRLWKWMLLVGFSTLGRLVPALTFGIMYNQPFNKETDEPMLECIDHGHGHGLVQTTNGRAAIRYYVYWATDSIITVFNSAILLVIWVKLFLKSPEGRRDGRHPDGLRYGTGTFVCLFVGSVLLFVKTMLLLKWKAEVIYERFSERMVRDGAQLYFLALLCGLRLRILGELAQRVASKPPSSEKVTLYRLQEIAECFQELALVSSRDGDDEDKHAAELVERCERLTNPQDRGQLESDLLNEFKFEYQDVQLFEQNLRNNNLSLETVQLQQWMVNVYSKSLTFGYTLLDANGLVDYLNKILMAIIAIVLVVTWLLITGVATTKVLVVIASPFLALTFVFGNMCKRIFEGIIFTFVSHPFIIGDKCQIEDNELEVKQMGVLRTRFEKEGTGQKFSYSNSELAAKAIVNLREEPTDQVELSLVSSTVTESNIQKLKAKIKRFLEDNPDLYSHSYQVNVTEIKRNVNMTISFKHQMRSHDANWLPQKRKQRSKFLLELNQMLIEAEIHVATS